MLGVPAMQVIDPAAGLTLRGGLAGVGVTALAEMLAVVRGGSDLVDEPF